MATKQFNLKDALASGSSAGSLQDGGSISSAATTTKYAGNSLSALDGRQIYGSTVAQAATYHTEPSSAPAGGANGAQDSWRSENTLSGTFAAGLWTVSIKLDYTCAESESGAIDFRVWRSVNANGTSAVELTGGIQRIAVAASLSSNPTIYSGTFNPGSVPFSTEYLFLEMAASDDGVGGTGLSTSWTIYVDSAASFITTTDFTAGGSAAPRLLASLGVGN